MILVIVASLFKVYNSSYSKARSASQLDSIEDAIMYSHELPCREKEEARSPSGDINNLISIRELL